MHESSAQNAERSRWSLLISENNTGISNFDKLPRKILMFDAIWLTTGTNSDTHIQHQRNLFFVCCAALIYV